MRVPVTLPAGWEPALRAVLPGRLSAGPLRALGAGLDCWALLAGDDVVLRIPQNAEAADAVARDLVLLPVLGPLVPVSIPRPLFEVSNPLGPGPIAAYRLVPGEVFDPPEWHRRGLLTDANAAVVGRVVDALAAFSADRARTLGVPDSAGRNGYAADLGRLVADVAPRLGPARGAELVRRWRAFVDDDANFTNEPVVTHGDLSLDHLVVNGGVVTGLIDFGDVAVDDPDTELGLVWAEAGPAFVAAVQRGRGRVLTPALAAKLVFFQLADEAGDVLWGIDTDRPEVRDAALARLARSLDEPPGAAV